MSTDNTINIVYQNVRGINTKITSLYANSFDFTYHVIAFTETWLNDKKNIHNAEILCPKYQLFRYDRPHKLGGGVLIAVLNLFSCELIEFLQRDFIEFVAVKIRLTNGYLFITCSYIPPNSSSNIYDLHISAIGTVLQQSNPSDIFVVLGDFNLPNILWNKPLELNYLIPTVSNEFIISLLGCGLFQVNHVHNACGRLLDLAFVNQPMDIYVRNSLPITYPEDRHHPTIEVEIYPPSNKLTPPINRKKYKLKKVYCFPRTNYTKLNFLLSNVNWNAITSGNNFDDIVSNFYSVLHHFISETVPKIFIRDNKGPPWNNKFLINAKNRKNKSYKKYKRTGFSADFANYSIARSEYNITNKLAYDNYIARMTSKMKSNPKSFYKFINSKRRASDYPKYLKFGPCIADDDTSICNMFADFFATTYSKNTYDNSTQYPFNLSHSSGIHFQFISNETVLLNLRSLKSSFNSGPDGIPSCLLKNCAESLCGPLTTIFNTSIKLCYLPLEWKKSFIIPLFKSGSKLEVSNYRGIAMLNAIPKLLEKILTDSLSHQTSSLLSTCQHGFRKSRSTTTNILELTTIVNNGFLNKMQTDVIYTDFSKAFDKVNHDILLHKLSLMGFCFTTLKWLSSYLYNRTQQVKFRGVTSKVIEVSSGVPQGSHLGPILFTLFINDLPSIILHSKVLMYADDVKIFKTFKEPNDQLLLQSDIDKLSQWCKINLMELNIKKCNHMSFFRIRKFESIYYINDSTLLKVHNINDLGVLLDHRLNFRDHITLTVNKAMGVLGFMKRWSKEFSDPYITKQLYTSLVRPILEYGSIIWDPCYSIHISSIESVQKQFLIFCLRGLGWNSYVLPSYVNRLGLIKLPTLKSRRVMLSISFLLGLIRGDVDSEFLLGRINFCVPTRPTRNFQLLNLKYYRSVYANNDCFRRICENFNKCYHIINISESNDVVKRKIILHLNN